MSLNIRSGRSIEEQLNDYGCKFDEKRVKCIECLNRMCIAYNLGGV